MISPALQALALLSILMPRTSKPVLFLLCGSELECTSSEGLPVRESQPNRQPVGLSPATSGFQCHRSRFRADRDGFNLLKNLTIRTGSVFCNFRNCHAASRS